MKPRISFLAAQKRGCWSTYTVARCVHTTNRHNVSAGMVDTAAPTLTTSGQPAAVSTQASDLSCLPLSNVLRTYFVTRISSSPAMLSACFGILNRMLRSESALMSPERNPALSWLLKKTFYSQFCAGETPEEVGRKVDELKRLGYEGVILEFALEVLEGDTSKISPDGEETRHEVERWKQGMLDSINLASSGDFVGYKWTGLGKYALHLLKSNQRPTPLMEKAILEACDLAAKKNVGLLPGAEEEITNVGIDNWNTWLQHRYNKSEPGRAIMFTTYQTYLRSTPARLAKDLAAAHDSGYTLGVKLVRGAYLSLEPKESVWSSKEETDRCYDDLTERLLRKRYGGILQPVTGRPEGTFPDVDIVLASHNAESIRKARAIRNTQVAQGELPVRLAYAQLLGMADEIGCNLIKAGRVQGSRESEVDRPRAFKCATWGTQAECLNFLLRRASENKDAVSRTDDSRKAMGRELQRRIMSSLGIWNVA